MINNGIMIIIIVTILKQVSQKSMTDYMIDQTQLFFREKTILLFCFLL